MKKRDLLLQWLSWKKSKDGVAFSQKKLASRAGISPTYLSNIITGSRNPGTKTLERIADALDITMADFYAGPRQCDSQMEANRIAAVVPDKVREVDSVLRDAMAKRSPSPISVLQPNNGVGKNTGENTAAPEEREYEGE
ncbi:helix-turn-helix domain-containing protein, partial [Candidatus Latescibacterota bacterium]